MTRPSFKLLASCATASAAVLVFLTLPAFAGFEWRGSAPTAAPVAAAPAATSSAQNSDDQSLNGLEPVLSWDGSPTKMPAEKVVAVETTPMDPTKPMALVPASNNVLPITADLGVEKSSQSFTPPEEIISGFGSDLPLAIALPQITPPGYQYNFAAGVDAGQAISWDGGKGWKLVLADALKPAGLGYQVEGNTIKIMRASDVAASSTFADSGMRTIAVTPSGQPESRIKTDAATVPMGEPVTIRRQKPSLLASKNKKTTDVIVPTVPPADLAAAQLPVTAPAENLVWDAAPPADKTAQMPVSLTEKPTEDVWAPPVPIAAPPAPAPQPQFAPVPPTPLTAPPAKGLSVAETLTLEMPNEASEPEAISAPVPAIPPQSLVSLPPAEQQISTPVADEAPRGWHATRGETLREVLTAWGQDANVDLYWSIDYDYKLLKNFDSNKSFEEAVGSLLEQFTEARPQPYGQLHQSSKGPKVLVIRSYDLVD